MRVYGTTFRDYDIEIIRRCQLGMEAGQFITAAGADAFAESRDRIGAYFAKLSRLSMHGACFDMNYTSGDPLIVEVVKKRFAQSLAIAAYYGIGKVVFHSTYTKFERKTPQSLQRWLDRSAAFWMDFAPEIPKGIQVYLENVEEEEPQVFLALIRSVGESGVGCCFDAGHAFCHSTVPVEKWVEVLGKRIGHVHFHDNDGASDQHLPPGMGRMPAESALRALTETVSPETPFVFECDLSPTLQWLTAHGFIQPFADMLENRKDCE